MDCWIVVVDDEALSLTNAKNILNGENMRVSCLRSGKDLLKYVEKNSPDLILLDIMMPEMDGFETYQALREYEKKSGKPDIPVIFLTGENDSGMEQKGLELGASDYIRKPFDKDILLSRIRNIVSNRRTIANLTEEARFDKLTGFLNKSHGTERVAKLCRRKTGALMILDLDNFKLVNDLFGHETGDRVLAAFADTMRNNTRETDTLSRIGGDEFLAFYEDLTDESSIAAITCRLNHQLSEEAERIMGADHGIPLGISIGVVIVPEEGRDYEKLFALADSAMYTVKQNGKHGYHIYSRFSSGTDSEEADPEQKLERIIKIVEERNSYGGALVLGSDSFSLVYRFIMRFYKRYGGTAALLLLTPTIDDNDNGKLMEISVQFVDMLRKMLRMSDIIMQNGANSFFVLLTERTKTEAEGALERIIREWEKTEHDETVKIEHAFKYIDLKGE